jgi:hypothetical protein
MRTVAAQTAHADGKLSLQDCAKQLACASRLVLFTLRSRRCFLERRGQRMLERCQFGVGEVVENRLPNGDAKCSWTNLMANRWLRFSAASSAVIMPKTQPQPKPNPLRKPFPPIVSFPCISQLMIKRPPRRKKPLEGTPPGVRYQSGSAGRGRSRCGPVGGAGCPADHSLERR